MATGPTNPTHFSPAPFNDWSVVFETHVRHADASDCQ